MTPLWQRGNGRLPQLPGVNLMPRSALWSETLRSAQLLHLRRLKSECEACCSRKGSPAFPLYLPPTPSHPTGKFRMLEFAWSAEVRQSPWRPGGGGRPHNLHPVSACSLPLPHTATKGHPFWGLAWVTSLPTRGPTHCIPIPASGNATLILLVDPQSIPS